MRKRSRALTRPRASVVPAESPDAVTRVIESLRRGEIVSFPTDTVYALAAVLDQPEALSRLYEVKGRPESKPIPVLLSCAAAMSRVATELAPATERFVERFWPGPLTVVLPARSNLPPEIIGASPAGTPTVAVRVPDHALAQTIIERAGGAIAATSANRSGVDPGLTAQEVATQLDSRVQLILDGGRVPGGVASTVVALGPDGPIVLRAGAVAREEIAQVWKAAQSGTS